MKPLLFRLIFPVVSLFFITGCAKKNSHAHQQNEHDHGHAHTAPHGGTLVELGEHQFNLEFLHDRSTGKLTAYILDGHADDFVRVTQRTIELNVLAQGQTRVLALNALANSATGETVGNTSQFEASADWLKVAEKLKGLLIRLEIRGTPFSDVPFALKPVDSAKP